ncbi:MAG TPA: carbon starvation protein A [Bacteroidales bacterium]|jgi:carbon starvation protein CstA|nr:carbon starvation protein A [Bacteroidales bacterium]HPT53214.1 carbon starvation protein A [Bacteroidales bacterium]
MITFILSLVILIAGYFFYGKLTEKIFGIDTKRQTAAVTKQDGVDYIPMKPWRIFLIQFLNIAGVGPIFGAIMGAKFGTVSFLWIVFGSILGGAVHDYLSGMISLRQDGASLPEIHGKYLGKGMKQFMRAFMVILMVLVGAVFVSAPATLLAGLTSWNVLTWIVVIIIYYVIATLLPIDKIIGKIYPIFGICMLFMVVGILFSIFYYQPELPEVWDGIQNRHPDAATTPIFPMMFISIACGAISGFHATQSPLMARCMTNEKQGRPIFFGAMITEGIVALIWAAAASYFFFDTPIGQVGFAGGTDPASIVDYISKEWLGTVGAVLALLGVVAAPITSGDTAFRSARLIVADFMHYDQKPIKNRLFIAIPLFAAGIGVLIFSVTNQNGFDIIWRYFAWANQLLAAVTLWAVTVYLVKEKKCFWITLLPAIFMTMVCSSFIFIAEKEGFGFNHFLAYSLGALVTIAILILFVVRVKPFHTSHSVK